MEMIKAIDKILSMNLKNERFSKYVQKIQEITSKYDEFKMYMIENHFKTLGYHSENFSIESALIALYLDKEDS